MPKIFKPKGFTAVELLLGLALFAVIATSLYGILSTGIRLNQKSQTINRVSQEGFWALEQMVHDLENIVGYDFSNSYPDRLAFEGGNDTISFILPAAEGIKFVSYYLYSPEQDEVTSTVIGVKSKKNIPVVTRLIKGQTTVYLVREEQPFIDSLQTSGIKQGDIEILSTNVKEDGLKFFYAYLKDETQKTITWENQWNKKYVPFGLRAEISLLQPNEKNKELVFQKDILIPTGFWGRQEEE